MTAYRYWRIKATAMHGSSSGFLGCKEVKWMTVFDGAQAATGGTAMADSGTAANAYDSDGTTIWNNSGGGTNGWIGYDFGSAVTIKEVWWTCREGAWQQVFTAADVQGSSDGSSWTTVKSWTPATWTFEGQTQGVVVQDTKPSDGTSGAGSHRYWRLLTRTEHSSSRGYMAAAEVVWRTSSGGSQVASGGTALAGSQGGVANAAAAYDGNTDTSHFWNSKGIGWDWIGYDFGTAKQIAEVAYTARNDSSFNQIWTTSVVQSSDDGVTWTTAKSLTASTWSAGSTQTFTIQAAGGSGSVRPVVFICT